MSTSSETPAGFPIVLDLAGQSVLVVGGGEAAAAKCRLLAPSGARIRVVAPAPAPDIADLARQGTIALDTRRFAPQDLDGVRLCYVALDDAGEAAGVVAEARARGVLVNAVDRPALCDFATPAIVRRGPIAIAIATGGAAPALARNLRARIEAAVPAGFGALAAFCGAWRGRVAAALSDSRRQRRFWDAALEGPPAAAMLRGDRHAAEHAMRQAIDAAVAGRDAAPAGHATLVGAGPGDARLLTLAAVQAIQQADIILYDRLVGPAVLELARRDAARVDVGKRCGRHAMKQAEINALLVRHVRAGSRVVRLKGGDPFVFGRGGEELQALRDAGCTVDVIPGVTTALAAAASLGMPLTHRGVSQSLHLVTAHAHDGALPRHDWAALVRSRGTLAIYMGARTLHAVAAALLAAGLPAETPAVAIANVSLPGQTVDIGPLSDLPRLIGQRDPDGPTMVLIGEMARLAAAPGCGFALARAA